MSSYAYSPVGIDHYLAVLRRRWPVVVGGVLVGALTAGAYLAAVGETSTATTDVNLNVISTDPFNADRSASGLLDGTTEAQIASSYVVAAQAAEALGGEATPEQLRRGLDVNVVADATVIRISYSSRSTTDAQAGADAIADSYLVYRATQAQQRLGGVLDRIDLRLADLRVELVDANARSAAAGGGTSDANQAASDRDLIVIEIDALLSQKNSLDLIDTEGGAVLTSAIDNEVVVEPRTGLILAIGALAGLVLGVIAAFVMAALTRRVHGVPDIELATQVRPLLESSASKASIPEKGRMLDALRVARERMFATLDPAGAVIVVLDETRDRAASDLPFNLAVVCTQAGQETLLIAPGMSSEYFGVLQERLGLEELQSAAGGGLFASRQFEGLTIGVSDVGRPVADIEFAMYLRSLTTSVGAETLVLIVLPPGAPHAVELAAARLADASAIVTALGVTRSSRLAEIIEEFDFLDTPFIGALVSAKHRRLSDSRGEERTDTRPAADAEPTVGSESAEPIVPQSLPPAGTAADDDSSERYGAASAPDTDPLDEYESDSSEEDESDSSKPALDDSSVPVDTAFDVPAAPEHDHPDSGRHPAAVASPGRKPRPKPARGRSRGRPGPQTNARASTPPAE